MTYKMCTATSIFQTILTLNNSNSFAPIPGTVPTVPDSISSPNPKNVCRVLGIDPGLASTGWGIVDFASSRYRLVAYGVIETKKNTPHAERLLAIYNRIYALVTKYKPTIAGMETLFFAKNVTSAMGVSEARGVLSLCLAQHCVPLENYTPNEIKQSVTGTGKADKELVQNYVKLLLGLIDVPKPDHAADALAAAITCIHSAKLF